MSETLEFAESTKLHGARDVDLESPTRYQAQIEESILSSLSISHAKDTAVGNEFIRGVSGGERKRVSIAEVMAAQV